MEFRENQYCRAEFTAGEAVEYSIKRNAEGGVIEKTQYMADETTHMLGKFVQILFDKNVLSSEDIEGLTRFEAIRD